MRPRWQVSLEWNPHAPWCGVSWVWLPEPGARGGLVWQGVVGLVPGLRLHVGWRPRAQERRDE